ncbi:MAG: hypothetical protein EB059_11380, partial [Alphaproteobacteria bacterium]|nr:hypothetical protein [Alphaproteobacteria bacterium]
RHGKAYGAKLAKVQHMDLPLGIVTLPPEPWQRALSHAKQENIAAIMCSESKILKSCQEQLPMLAPLMTYDAVVRADLDQACDALAAPRISLKCGAELVIESTEALTAIDVNQATASHILTANLEAMKETARQIRLRDIRGIIVIDALKLSARTDQAKLLNILKTAVSTDWRKVHVFGMTKLGLIELTRSSA